MLAVEVAAQVTVLVRAARKGAPSCGLLLPVAVAPGHVHFQGVTRGAALPAAEIQAPNRLLAGL